MKTPALREIRANYDRDSIVVYQAYNKTIATKAVEHQRFVAPFSFRRMTWIKPSFLWLMSRSQWGKKSGQEHILAVRISRAGWEKALSLGVLTDPDLGVYTSGAQWESDFSQAVVHVQWDPERNIRGDKLHHRSIQVGLSRHVIEEFVDSWIVEIEDMTPKVRKIRELMRKGKWDQAKRLLPSERVYPLKGDFAQLGL